MPEVSGDGPSANITGYDSAAWGVLAACGWRSGQCIFEVEGLAPDTWSPLLLLLLPFSAAAAAAVLCSSCCNV